MLKSCRRNGRLFDAESSVLHWTLYQSIYCAQTGLDNVLQWKRGTKNCTVDNQVSLQQICQRLNPESKQIQSSGLWSLKQDSISGGAEHIHVKKNLLYGECYLRWNRAGLEAKYTLERKQYTHNTHKQMNKVHTYSRA